LPPSSRSTVPLFASLAATFSMPGGNTEVWDQELSSELAESQPL